MGAQPFWILFDANVIENWKRHIISQKGGNYPPLERRNKWNWKIWRTHKIEPGQILLNKSSGKCSWTTWANTTINLVIERNQLTSRSPIFSWHIEHFTESEYAQHVYCSWQICIVSFHIFTYCTAVCIGILRLSMSMENQFLTDYLATVDSMGRTHEILILFQFWKKQHICARVHATFALRA